jgi:hypothetical protein
MERAVDNAEEQAEESDGGKSIETMASILTCPFVVIVENDNDTMIDVDEPVVDDIEFVDESGM